MGEGGEVSEARARAAAKAAAAAGLWGVPGGSLALSREPAGRDGGGGGGALGVPACRLGLSGLAYARARSSARHRLPPVLPQSPWPRLTPWTREEANLAAAEAAGGGPGSAPREGPALREVACQTVADAGTQTMTAEAGAGVGLCGGAASSREPSKHEVAGSVSRQGGREGRGESSAGEAGGKPSKPCKNELPKRSPESFVRPWFSSSERCVASQRGGGAKASRELPASVQPPSRRSKEARDEVTQRIETTSQPPQGLHTPEVSGMLEGSSGSGRRDRAGGSGGDEAFETSHSDKVDGEAPEHVEQPRDSARTEPVPCIRSRASCPARRLAVSGGKSELRASLNALENILEAQYNQLHSNGYIRDSGTPGTTACGTEVNPLHSLRELERTIEEQHDELVSQGALLPEMR